MKRICLCVMIGLAVGCMAGCGGKPDPAASKDGPGGVAFAPAAPESLRAAIESGDIQAALASIAAGADVTAMYQGEQPLHLAARSGRKEIVEAILGKGVDPKTPTQRGYTALHLASTPDVACLLVQRGLDVDETSPYRETPLHMASEAGYVEVVDYLLSMGANPKARARDGDIMALNYAATRPIAEKLVAAGAPMWGETNQWGRNRPPLWSAAAKGRADVAAYIMENGLPPPPRRGRDDYIEMALFNAVQGRHSAVVDAVLSHGGKVDSRKSDGFMAQAVKRADTNTVRIFLEKSVKSADQYHVPAIEAAGQGDVGLLTMILDAGGNANAGNSIGHTPLHAAAAAAGSKEDHLACLRLLLSRGADAKASKTVSQITPLHLAAAANFTAGIELLAQHGVDIDAEDEVSATPLHWAVINDAVDAATFLLSRGANPSHALSKQAAVHTRRQGEPPNPFGGRQVAGQVPLKLAKSEAMKALLKKHGATESAAPGVAPARHAAPSAPVVPTVRKTETAVPSRPPAGVPEKKRIAIGDTEGDVIAALGPPKGRMKAGGETILQYSGGEVTLTGGKVIAVSGQLASP